MPEKMNVLFFITDQLRVDQLGCYGNSVVKTPNLNKLADEGVRFTNAFCTNPMCMPNRATILTGLYPNVHGVRSNGINLPIDVPTITDALYERGWYTINVGKTHFNFWTPSYKNLPRSAESFDDWVDPKGPNTLTYKNFPMPYYGFREMNLIVGHGTLCLGHYLEWLEERSPKHAQGIKEKFKLIDNFFTLFCEGNIPEELYNTRYIEQHTISFLERYAKGEYGNKPFFLHCSFPDPHHPVCPPSKYRTMYKPDDIELPISFYDIQNLYKHPFLAPHMEKPAFRGALLRESTIDEVKKFTALYYGAITLVDNAIGNILGALEKLGLSDNTMIVFTSDHGDFMGDHGMLLKGPAPFNGVLQVPLIWKVPRMTKPGKISNALISSVDLPKTILSILGLKERYQPVGMQGYNMTPILESPGEQDKEIRDCCLIAQDEEVGPKGPMYVRLRHLITKKYKLTIYEGIKDYGDLYNRKNDKDELKNLWFDKRYKNSKYQLVERLLHEDLKIQSRFPARQAAT
jgi:arylsulfatase A-like enzyme